MQGRIFESVPDGLTVIETMRAENGVIALWPLHFSRLQRGCSAVGFPLGQGRIAAGLAGVPRDGLWRVRLTVDATGAVAVTCHDLPPALPFWRVRLSSLRLDSGDPWLQIKTSHRPIYDAARQAMAADVDEVILMNERGELCEGTITNLFLRRNGRLLTPPVGCGVLPGVLRASLLARGEAEEAILTPADLADGDVFMGNALRGLIPARI